MDKTLKIQLTFILLSSLCFIPTGTYSYLPLGILEAIAWPMLLDQATEVELGVILATSVGLTAGQIICALALVQQSRLKASLLGAFGTCALAGIMYFLLTTGEERLWWLVAASSVPFAASSIAFFATLIRRAIAGNAS